MMIWIAGWRGECRVQTGSREFGRQALAGAAGGAAVWAQGGAAWGWNIGNSNVHNMEEVTLNPPGRDKKIEEYTTYLRNLRKAGIYYTTYVHMGNGIWSIEREFTRGAGQRL